MTRLIRIVVDISGHGLGHLAQVTPVLVELRRRLPACELLVRSAIAERTLRAFLGPDVTLRPPAAEVGLIMKSPSVPDLDASWKAYLDLHRDWPTGVEREADLLRGLSADLLIADVSYTGIAAAALAGIPAIAVGSLHWGEVVRAYFTAYPEAVRIAREIERSYAQAQRFFVPAPRTAVPGLGNQSSVGLLARWWGKPLRDSLVARARVDPGCRIGLVSFGGVRQGLPDLRLPDGDEWLWLAPGYDAFRTKRASAGRCLGADDLRGLSHLDLLASSDLVLTKTGYSTFAECLHYGVPCLFLSRPDWPEAVDLERYMVAAGIGRAIAPSELATDQWLGAAGSMAIVGSAQGPLLGHVQIIDAILKSTGIMPSPGVSLQ